MEKRLLNLGTLDLVAFIKQPTAGGPQLLKLKLTQILNTGIEK